MIPIKVYTCGYMAGEGSPRYDWRKDLVASLVGTNIIWLHPGCPPGDIPGQGNRALYGPRDALMVKHCDVLFAFIDFEVARCIGASWEMGLAFGYDKRIILVDCQPEIGSLDLNRWGADSVWTKLTEGSAALRFIADGYSLPPSGGHGTGRTEP